MKSILKLSLALALTCGIAATVLFAAYEKTKVAAAETQQRIEQEALQKVLPAYDNQPLQEENVVSVREDEVVILYTARREQAVVGYAAKARTDRGFGGELEVLVGFQPDGTVGSVVITAHAETPGLGTLATERKVSRTLADVIGKKSETAVAADALPPSLYLDQFTGLQAHNLEAFRLGSGAIDAVSGATISSRAVADAVRKAVEAFIKEYGNAAAKEL